MEKMTQVIQPQVAKNFNVEVICRILSVLYQNGPSKITNLAMSTHLNHVSCKKYVNLLITIDWIEIEYVKAHTIINVTNIGRTIFKKLKRYDPERLLN